MANHSIPSHTFLPQTIPRQADRAPDDKERPLLRFAKRCPTRRAPTPRAPTSRRNSATGQPSRAQFPAPLFSLSKPRAPIPHFLKLPRHAVADGNDAARQPRHQIFLLELFFALFLKLFPPQSAACENPPHDAYRAIPAIPRETRPRIRRCAPA